MSFFVKGGKNVMLCYWWQKCQVLTIGGTNATVAEMSGGTNVSGTKVAPPNITCKPCSFFFENYTLLTSMLNCLWLIKDFQFSRFITM